MRKIIQALMLSAAVMLPAISVANAFDLTCGIAQLDFPGRNDVVKTTVSVDGHAWTVLHTLRNGTVIDRSVQYLMIDNSNNHKTQWIGRLNGYPMFYMVGEVKFLNATGQPVYHEWLYKYGVLTMHSMSLCQPIEPDIEMPTS